jgi:NosR/NirI family transcriptional regulator, nitrous oxide reductase regulator
MNRSVALLLTGFFALVASGPAWGQGVAGPGDVGAPTVIDCATQPCDLALPSAARFEGVENKPYAIGFDADDAPVGWVVLSTSVVDIKGYSGKPMATLVGLSSDGHITGGKVIHHSEPILLVGIPESELSGFVNAYAGLKVGQKVVLGGEEPGARSVDIVSGATVTVLAENRTILASARILAEDVGVIEPRNEVPGHFVEDPSRWSWSEIVDRGAVGHLSVTHDDMGIAGGDQAFVDVWFGLADAPHVGIPLLGERTWQHAVDKLEEGEHLFVVYGNGSSSFRGSGFVRGGIFDRIRLEQGLRMLMFRDSDYKRLGQPIADGAPHFGEGALFVARGGKLDPGRSFDFVFLGSAFDYEGGFSRKFHTFASTWRAPKSVYVLDGPDPESQVWRQAWKSKRVPLALISLYLLAVTGVFVFRKWSTETMPRLQKLHTGFLVVTFVGLGLGLSLQPSVTQLLTLVGSVAGEWRWGLFLSDPFLFVSWTWIAVVTLIWGRGVFCGWACPYGALNELTFKIGRLLKLPTFELPDAWHNKLRYVRYVVLAGLVVVFLISPELGERLAEVEPFKSTFFVAPWTRGILLTSWWLLLFGGALVVWRPFCRYVCPLGAALALPSSIRLSGPRRRDFCTSCKICTKGCEPRAIRPNGTIDPRECLNCWECEANYYSDEVCPPLIGIRRQEERKAKKARKAANHGPQEEAS